jgi:hypothetical protein
MQGIDMSDKTDDEGTIQALLDRLVKVRLPRTLEIKQRIDGGQRLGDNDIAFLKSALEDAKDGARYVARNPEFHALGAQVAQLYDEIVRKAFENEKSA